MRPTSTTKYVSERIRSKFELESIKLWVEIVGLILVFLTLACYVWLAFLQKDANKINEKALGTAQRGLDLAQLGIALNQKSLELTQESLALTEQSVKASEQALRFASRANDLSEKGLAAANTPSVGMRIDRIEYKNDNEIIITYVLTNHSSLVANYVTAECFLEGVRAPDIAQLATGRASIMPNSSFQFYADFYPDDFKAAKRGIETGQIDIRFIVEYKGPLDTRANFSETFEKNLHLGGFATVNLEPDIDFDKEFLEEMNATKPERKK